VALVRTNLAIRGRYPRGARRIDERPDLARPVEDVALDADTVDALSAPEVEEVAATA
jgi:hypothetical protein